MKSRAFRTDPGSGQPIGVLKFIDPMMDPSQNLVYGQHAEFGHPLSLIKIAEQTNTAGRMYPYRGTGAFLSGCTTTVLNVSGMDSIPKAGLGIHIMTGASSILGQSRIITASASGSVTIDPPLAAAPAAGNTFDLFVDCFRFKQLVIKAEAEVTGASIPIIVVLMDCPPQSTTVPPARPAIYYADEAVTIKQESAFVITGAASQDNLPLLPPGVSSFITEDGYFHASSYVVDCSGALGAKILMPDVPGTPKWSFWAGGC